MLNRTPLAALLCAFMIVPAAPAAADSRSVQVVRLPAMFDTEYQAQAHCPRDIIVWLNITSHIYHEKGMRWYGRTKHGAYVCKKEADTAGDRDTRNGQ